MEQTQDAYEQRIQAQLAEWQADIDKLSAKAKRADAEAKIEIANHLDKLKARRAVVHDRLDELRSSGRGAWRDLKTGLEKAVEDLSTAVTAARSHFS